MRALSFSSERWGYAMNSLVLSLVALALALADAAAARQPWPTLAPVADFAEAAVDCVMMHGLGGDPYKAIASLGWRGIDPEKAFSSLFERGDLPVRASVTTFNGTACIVMGTAEPVGQFADVAALRNALDAEMEKRLKARFSDVTRPDRWRSELHVGQFKVSPSVSAGEAGARISILTSRK